MKRLFSCLCFCSILILCSDSVVSQDAATDASALRMKFMKQALSQLELSAVDKVTGRREKATLHAPLMRWSNPLEGAKDGVIGVFFRGGRPDVCVEFQMFSAMSQGHEFTAITTDEIQLTRRGETIWRPTKRWIEFNTIESGDVAETESRRLLQMRTIARRFRFVDEFGGTDDNIQSNDLRLISKPVFRYSSPEITDGALFVFALGTDPEAILLVEAFRDGTGRPAWRYACGESTIYELNAYLDGNLIWNKPRALVFDSSTFGHFAGQYPRDSNDIPLNRAFPNN